MRRRSRDLVLGFLAFVVLAGACSKDEPRRRRRDTDDEESSTSVPRPAAPPVSEKDVLARHLATRAEVVRATPPSEPVAESTATAAVAPLSPGLGSGSGRLGSGHRSKPPSVRMGATSVSGRLPPEVIQRIVRQNFGRFRLCYEAGLRSNPTLAGRVSVSFTINNDGSVGGVSGGGDLPDAGVVSCVTKAFWALSFPSPESGVVKVTYPIAFSPGDIPGAPKIDGAAIGSVGPDEVKRALEKAGCIDVTKVEKLGAPKDVIMFTAKYGGLDVKVTFVPSSAASPMPASDIIALEAEGVLFRELNFLLAIVVVGDPSKAIAKNLLDAVVVR